MIYMPDREQLRLTVERDGLDGWTVVSPTHGMLYATGATRAEALAAVEPALIQLDRLDAELRARGGSLPVSRPDADEDMEPGWGALPVILACVAMWALMLAGAGAIFQGFGW